MSSHTNTPQSQSAAAADSPPTITKRQRSALRAIYRVSGIVDLTVLIASLLLLALGVFAVWDTKQVYDQASVEKFEQYKVVKDQQLSYQDAKKLNPDIIGWLDVYGTKINYPVLQTDDNSTYLNKSVTGEFSTAGSIFLDYRNKADFTNFNSLIYGHHMEQRKMFGDVDLFAEKEFFDTHRHGALHRTDAPTLGIEFFAIIKTHGADPVIFNVPVQQQQAKANLLSHIQTEAVHYRDIGVTTNDRIVLLNTCTFTTTNGRYVLIGRLVDTVTPNTFVDTPTDAADQFAQFLEKTQNIPRFFWFLLVLLALALICYSIERTRYRAQQKRYEKQYTQSVAPSTDDAVE